MKVYCSNTICKYSNEENCCTLSEIHLSVPVNYRNPLEVQCFECICLKERPSYEYTFYWKNGVVEKIVDEDVGLALCQGDYDSGSILDLEYWTGGRENEFVSEDILNKRREI